MAIINPEVSIVEGLVTVTNADYAPKISDNLIFVSTGNSDRTITLPLPVASIQGMRLFVKKTDSGSGDVILDASTNGATIDGSNSMKIIDQYGGVEIVNDGSTWYCLSDGRAPKVIGFTGDLDCATTSVASFINGHMVSST
jgi:hypothetical protein